MLKMHQKKVTIIFIFKSPSTKKKNTISELLVTTLSATYKSPLKLDSNLHPETEIWAAKP